MSVSDLISNFESLSEQNKEESKKLKAKSYVGQADVKLYNKLMVEMDGEDTQKVVTPFHVFDYDPIQANGKQSVISLFWCAGYYRKKGDADWLDVDDVPAECPCPACVDPQGSVAARAPHRAAREPWRRPLRLDPGAVRVVGRSREVGHDHRLHEHPGQAAEAREPQRPGARG